MPACATCGFESDAAFRFCPECGAEQDAAPSREQRKTVTVLFCDLVGSTALGEGVDPERLRALLARYFESMKAIVERHGGAVEKFIGDAVMAVFGIPAAHEDDALRAVRAAAEMREALPELGLQGRIGVMTGEVVTGTVERLATGDAVNVAARLEQAAAAGDVLLGEPTLALVRDAVEVEAIAPLELKGKAEPVPAVRLLRVLEAPERRHGARFVGRDGELAVLRDALARISREQRCELVTVVGEAGVGKSRLVAEFLVTAGVSVIRGRCPPYGEGITYWPVVDVLRQLDLLPPDAAAATAIRSLLGESEAPTSAEEIAWAFRKTLEHVAAERALVVVFDDIQWGEETFLDLVEQIVLRSAGTPILLLCLARPELIESHPAWTVTLRLEPLGEGEVEELIPQGIAADLRERIAHAAGGNPLFVQEMLAVAADTKGDVVVPPTLKALLAARLDQLESAERSVLERGAIEGEVFHRGAVEALASADTQVTLRLAALVSKELIRPDRSQLAREDGFRFRHLLIRDAAYEALAKANRAELHARFAAWLEAHGSELVELDEILGYHLEQACRYRAELGLSEDEELVAAARRRLAAAGQRAQFRSDFVAAVSLLERVTALLPPTEIDLPLETMLIDSLFWSGKVDGALRRADSLAERATVTGDRVGELCGKVKASVIRLNLEPEGVTEELTVLVDEALPVFQAADDDLALYTAYHALGWIGLMHARMDAALEAFDQAALCARKAGLRDELVGWRALVRLWGTTPLSEVLASLDEDEARAGRDYWLRACRAWALATLGRFDEARTMLKEIRAELAERGGGVLLGWTNGQPSVAIELLAGNPLAAAEIGSEGCRLLEDLGERSILSTAAGFLAQALYALDRLEEADSWADRAAELSASEDALTQMLWRQARAKVLARRGQHVEAEQLAREAVTLCEGTDMLLMDGDVRADLAEVLLLAGDTDEAAAALEQALERYERKGNLVMAERTRERLAALGEVPGDA